MLRNDYEGQLCSVAGALEVIGERWTMLVVREVLYGRRRFSEMQRVLGVARNVLSARLERMVELGVLERRRYSERPERFEYFLTESGLDLWPVMIAMMNWGDRHLPTPPGGPPVRILHKGDCGGEMDDHRICERCGERLTARDVRGVMSPEAERAIAGTAS